MDEYVLAFKPAVTFFGAHDPSAAIFKNGDLGFAVEEERLTRQKHAKGTFPKKAIQECLDYYDISIEQVDKIVLPYEPKLKNKIFFQELEEKVLIEDSPNLKKIFFPAVLAKRHLERRIYPLKSVLPELSDLTDSIPPIELRSHHRCHAASSFHPSGFDEAVVLSIDGHGEYDSTVVWRGTQSGLERVKTYKIPNSLGHFYGIVTEFLGYRFFNGEGKVMGLAPYGQFNDEIHDKLSKEITKGAEYDVTNLTKGGIDKGVKRLEDLFGRGRNKTEGQFDQWQKDLAYVAQSILEEIVVSMVQKFTKELDVNNVCLSGGVALNCKLNKVIMEMDETDEIFIQPVANDAGLALGAGMLEQDPPDVETPSIYLGPEPDRDETRRMLEMNKLDYVTVDDPAKFTAEKISQGELVGWFQGRQEMGPRALGNRSILADPRTEESRDRVNEFVKHREGWRPFAPSLLEEAMDDYFKRAEPSPYMIKTFDTKEDKREELKAVVHPGDSTTRPQTVTREQNPKYYRLLKELEKITGVPVVLNTSFNDHGEPIVTRPKEALKDFYGMGLDVLVVENFVLTKGGQTKSLTGSEEEEIATTKT